MENKYNVDEIFDQYTESDKLVHANIFHLYDTGEECFKDNSGYHDSRHFRLIAFNTETMEKRDCGIHDGISCHTSDIPVYLIRVFADGSFFVRFKRVVEIEFFQCINLK